MSSDKRSVERLRGAFTHAIGAPARNDTFLCQGILFKSPLTKGDSKGLCFYVVIPHFHEDMFTTPLCPILRDLRIAYFLKRMNKMKHP